ncbi:MAG TPA: hypothetical protein VD902_09670 [Symbiobacteriaceae bacterium]|nr:hypothetical protein [Symbiobacteriaceae bacterium]
MNLQNLRWHIVAATMAVTVALLFGVSYVLNSQTVEQPLKAMLAGSAQVDSHRIERQGSRYVITVKLKDVPDLAQAYRTLHDEAGKVLKGADFALQVEDSRSPKLEDTYRRVNLYVQEALATGQYAAMADRVEAEAEKHGLTARMAVEGDRVFVQLHDGQAYLYGVAERPAKETEKQYRTEGGFGL